MAPAPGQPHSIVSGVINGAKGLAAGVGVGAAGAVTAPVLGVVAGASIDLEGMTHLPGSTVALRWQDKVYLLGKEGR